MLRQDNSQGGRQQRHGYEKLVEHAGAYLVVIAGTQIVDNARQADDECKEESGDVARGESAVIRRHGHRGDAGEVVQWQGEVLLIDEPHGCKPIGCEQSVDGGEEVAPAHGVKENDGEQPKHWYETECLRICHAGQANEEIGIVGPAYGRTVLIGAEEKEVGHKDAHRG